MKQATNITGPELYDALIEISLFTRNEHLFKKTLEIANLCKSPRYQLYTDYKFYGDL